jgi:integral membrane protein (TIGR01906 family)
MNWPTDEAPVENHTSAAETQDYLASARPYALPPWLITALGLFLTATLPVFLVLTGVRLVTTQTFLKIEYNRPGFPEDWYGFTKADRLKYAPYAVEYLRNDAGISYLGDLTFEDGTPLYEARELRHMEDVKTVMQAALKIHLALSVALAAAVIALAWKRESRWVLRRALAAGGIFTISLIFVLVVLIFVNWNFFFDGFHSIFFEGDSWQFSNSDTLIRLFPEQFWFDAAMSIGFFTVLGALAAVFGVRAWERRLFNLAQEKNQNGTIQGPVNDTDLKPPAA